LAHVIPIFKSGHKPLVSNYRPIALLYTVSATFGKVVCKYIFSFLVGNPFLYKFQSEFIPIHYRSHQRIELTHGIVQSLVNQDFICLFFCDVSKAFAGVPQGSILGLQLFFFNDIADNVLGLCRLFADEISVGERLFELNNLRFIVNIDPKKYYALGETVASQTKSRKKQK